MPIEKKLKEDEDEVEIDANGTKERSKITTNSKGQKVKVVTKVKVKEIKIKVPLRVLDRRNLPRFGDAKIGEENVTIPTRDFISFEHPDDQLTEDTDDPTLAKTLANFISKQAETRFARDNDLESLLDEPTSKNDEPTPKPEVGKYVAPGARGGVSMADRDKDGTENTIRVSNLTKAVTEDDLRDLFERFGKIHRISLPKVERPDGGKEPRGFAYIAFARREDAEDAMNRLQGYGYDHLIIKLEWAKTAKEMGGPPSNQYMSGYGKQLAQDTQEKVYYNSNLSSNR